MFQKHTMQSNEYECGLCCIETILKTQKIFLSKNSIRKVIGNFDSELSISDLVSFFSSLGGNLTVNYADFIQGEKLNFSKDGFPCIAFLENGVSNHFIVIYKIKNKYCFVSDPALPRTAKINTSTLIPKIKYLLVFDDITKITHKDKRKANFFSTKSMDKFSFKGIMSENRNEFIWILIFTIFSSILTLIPSYFMGTLVNIIENNAFQNDKFSSIMQLTILSAIVCLVQYINSNCLNRKIISVTSEVKEKLSSEYISKVFKIKLNIFDSFDTGEYLSRLDLVFDLIDTSFKFAVTIAINTGILLISFISIYLVFSLLTVPISFYFLIILIIMVKFFDNILKLEVSINKSDSELRSTVVSGLNGIDSIKHFQLEKYITTKINQKLLNFVSSLINYQKTNVVLSTSTSLISGLFSSLLLAICGVYVIQGRIPIGYLVMIISLCKYIIDSLNSIQTLQFLWEKILVCQTRITGVISNSFEGEKSLKKLVNIESKDFLTIYFKDFILWNPIGKKLIDDSFELHIRNDIQLLGISGVGKSSLVKCLIKENLNYSGVITINGTDIKSINENDIKNHIVYLTSNEKIFEGTIYENICFDIKHTKYVLNKICETLQISKSYSDKELSLTTALIEDGKNISMGQKQKIIFARAVIKLPKLIIADESFSNLPKQDIQLLLNLLKDLNIKLIYISHNDYKMTQKNYKLENEKVREVKISENLLRRRKDIEINKKTVGKV